MRLKKTAVRETPLDKILHLKPCFDAREWLKTQPNVQAAWNNCERPDWMFWLLGKTSGPPDSASRKKLVLAAADCAALVLTIFEKQRPGDKRVRECIKTLRRYAAGKASLADVVEARDAAADAADAADAAADAYAAAYAADAAAYAADAAAYAAAYAAYAAAADAYAAAYAAADARLKMQKRCAAVIRKHYPKAPRIKRRASA